MAVSLLTSAVATPFEACSTAAVQSSASRPQVAMSAKLVKLPSSTSNLQRNLQFKGLRTGRQSSLVVRASDDREEKTTVERVVETAVKTTRQGLSTATDLVPASVPRPVATAGVAVVGLLVASTILRSLFGTLIFFVVIGGLGYAAFVYLTQTGGDSGGGGSGSGKGLNPIDEARKIMDKYK